MFILLFTINKSIILIKYYYFNKLSTHQGSLCISVHYWRNRHIRTKEGKSFSYQLIHLKIYEIYIINFRTYLFLDYYIYRNYIFTLE